MAIQIDSRLRAEDLRKPTERLFELSAAKLNELERRWDPARGTPVFTVKGRYTARGWTEWTQGFQYGSAVLQFEATGEAAFLELGRRRTLQCMAPHVSSTGVHDHGFNNVSTYGNLLRLARAGCFDATEAECQTWELALKVSGAVQAARWTPTANGLGYIYSFNGPHSLFVDTLRSLRALGLAHVLGHALMGEHDERVNLLRRALDHVENTARFNVYYGQGRDAYDVRGRTAHESLFNVNDGRYRCPSSQQGYSPFSTWTRGLAWALCGFAEQLEFLAALPKGEMAAALAGSPDAEGQRTPAKVTATLLEAACATADFYLENACADGIPMWDTGAPNLHRLGDYLSRPADPFNDWEPVDSSAAAIAAQGLLRLGNYLQHHRRAAAGRRYFQAGLTVARTLLQPPYLSEAPRHQGLLLHSVYHRPNGWDYVAPGQRVPNGESSLWGDYHLRELGVMLLEGARIARMRGFFDSILR